MVESISRDIEASEYWQEQAKLLRGYHGQKEPETAVQEQPAGSESLSPGEDDIQSRKFREEALLAPLVEPDVFIASEPVRDHVYIFRRDFPTIGEPYQAKALSFVSSWEYGSIWLFELETGELIQKRVLIDDRPQDAAPEDITPVEEKKKPGFFWCSTCQKYHKEPAPVEYEYKRMLRLAKEQWAVRRKRVLNGQG